MYFHRANPRDSSPVVTPFVRVGTYPTRYFALLYLKEGSCLHPSLLTEHGVWSLKSRDCFRLSLYYYKVGSVFAHIAQYNSPSPSGIVLLQFQNLRTVIVTADIHQGLYQSPIILLLSTPIFDLLALVRCHPLYSSYDFAGSCVFDKQSPGILSLRPLLLEAGLIPKLRPLFCRVP